MYSNNVTTYEMLLIYDLRIRNTDLCFHLVSCYKKRFLGLKLKMLFLIYGMLVYIFKKSSLVMLLKLILSIIISYCIDTSDYFSVILSLIGTTDNLLFLALPVYQ